MTADAELHETLGEIKGLLKGLDKKVDGLEGKIDGQDERLRKVENRSIVSASVVGGVMAVATTIVASFIREKTGL